MTLDPFNIDGKYDRARRISTSVVNDADTCLHRLHWSMTDWSGHSPNTCFGSAFHAGLEFYYRAKQVDRFTDVETADIVSHAHHVFDQLEPDTDWVNEERSAAEWREKVERVLTFYMSHVAWPVSDGDPYIVVAVEEKFVWLLDGGWVVSGEPDLVLAPESDPGHHIIIDHKTANKKWEAEKHSSRKTAQPVIYTTFWPACWNEVQSCDPDFDMPACTSVSFYFDVLWELKSGYQHERRDGTPTAADRLAVLQKADLVRLLVDSGAPLYPNTGSQLCSERWCSWWDRCGYGGGQLIQIQNTPDQENQP